MRKNREIRCSVGALTLALLLVAAAAPSHAGSRGALPFDVALDVEFADGVGTASIRDEVEFVVLRELDSAGCFRSVHGRGDDGGGLKLSLTILDVDDQTRVEVSLAQSHDPSAPPGSESQQVARLELKVLMQLATVDDPVVFRSKRSSISEQHRPFLDEDPRAEVRYKTMDRLADKVVRFACKGSAKRMQREIDRAREDAAKGSSGPR